MMSDMFDMTDDNAIQNAPAQTGETDEKQPVTEKDKALVKDMITEIKADKRHHEKAFKRMRRDMKIAMHGADDTWSEASYRANITGRHIKRKTGALYAKNPKTVARRRDTLDFAVWDETPESLQIAQQTSMLQQQAVQAAQAQPPMIDPMTNMSRAPEIPVVPGAEEAQALLQDFQQGMQTRQFAKKFGDTMERLDAYMLNEQAPLDFKRGMKQVARRVCATGVGYVEYSFQRELGSRPATTEKLADARARLDHMRRLTEEVGEGDIGEDDAEMAELEHSVASLQAEPDIILREGIIVDYPASTKVIPDRMCKYLEGFVGARWVTIEYTYTPDQVEELFGVDVRNSYTAYNQDKGSSRAIAADDILDDDFAFATPDDKRKNGVVCVWKSYNKVSGLVYYMADGYPGFLREPAAPDVFVNDFWPVYALTFNEIESEEELFPPSDVTLLRDAQMEYNRSRQGMREHRQAARPRWVYANGAFGDENDPMHLQNLRAFEALAINIAPEQKIGDILQGVPMPGVDPNLYETNQFFTDMQLISGAQEAQYGATSDATATQSAIAAGATSASDSDAMDDMDGFLTKMARARGQIYQREMSAEQVTRIVGRGAVWPEVPLADIAGEIYLDIEAGSSGRPNQAVEVNNWKQMVPLLLQIPGISPLWLARETVRRLDDKVDLSEAVTAGIMSIAAQNSASQAMQPNVAGPGEDPNAQGGQGANNAPKPAQQPGSDAPMGDNHTTPAEQRTGGVFA